MKKEIKIMGRTYFTGKVFSVDVDQIVLPDGNHGFREVVKHPGGVCVLPIIMDEQNKPSEIILVKQYRYAAGKFLLEIPAGRIEPEEKPIDTAKRELKEETGYNAGEIANFGTIIPTGGYCSEVIHIFLATNLTPGEQKLDEGEFLDVIKMPFDNVFKMVQDGEIEDAKTAFAILKLACKLRI